jgi:hypothetical protein
MYVCEYVWDPVQASQVRELLERATGEPCPCKQGKPCPFIRLEAPEPVALDPPQMRRDAS